MKRGILLPLLLLSMATGAWAKPVSKQVLDNIAVRFFGGEVLSELLGDGGEMRLYHPVAGQGFLLLSTDDCVRPVLGYSRVTDFSAESMPNHVLDWFMGLQQGLANAISHAGERHPEWDRLLEGSVKEVGSRSVSPLITSTWNQSFPYNSQCPYDSVGADTSLVGCVATATAQVMRFWGHPATGRGSYSYTSPHGPLSADFGATSYDWTHMPNVLSSLSTPQEIEAVAQLCYHVGVAVEMDYSGAFSGAEVSSSGFIAIGSAEKALKTYFRYNPTLYADYRDLHSGAEWDSLCMRQLDNDRPIIYGGFGPVGGHAFVVDGYDSLGFFHVNWGWGGFFDGYFLLDSLDAGNGYRFDENSVALMDVFPITIDNPQANIYAAPDNRTHGSVRGAGIFSTDSLSVLLFADAAPGYRFDHWTTGDPGNPLITSPTRSFRDTACFLPLNLDTFSYAIDKMTGDVFFPPDSIISWGIRIPSNYFGIQRQLDAVQLYVYTPGQYQLEIYSGETPDSSVYSGDYEFDEQGWHTLPLDIPLPLFDTLPLWITFTTDGSIARTLYSGQPDGSWVKLEGTWTPVHQAEPLYASWLIRAIMAPARQVNVAVSPNDITMGDVVGGGLHWAGETVTLQAVPRQGYRFVNWGDSTSTDNPLVFVVSHDTILIAFFESLYGISDVDADGLLVSLDGRTLTINNPQGLPVGIYDVQGRQLYAETQHATSLQFQLPAPGVYLLRFSDRPARKVVVLR